MQRRSILKNLSAATAGGAGFSGTSSGKKRPDRKVSGKRSKSSRHRKLRNKYKNINRIEKALQKHAQTLLSELREEGIINTSNPEELQSIENGNKKVRKTG